MPEIEGLIDRWAATLHGEGRLRYIFSPGSASEERLARITERSPVVWRGLFGGAHLPRALRPAPPPQARRPGRAPHRPRDRLPPSLPRSARRSRICPVPSRSPSSPGTRTGLTWTPAAMRALYSRSGSPPTSPPWRTLRAGPTRRPRSRDAPTSAARTSPHPLHPLGAPHAAGVRDGARRRPVHHEQPRPPLLAPQPHRGHPVERGRPLPQAGALSPGYPQDGVPGEERLDARGTTSRRRSPPRRRRTGGG